MKKPLTEAQIQQHIKRAGITEHYEGHLEMLIALLDAAAEEGQGSLAGFLFASAALSREIDKRYNKPKK